MLREAAIRWVRTNCTSERFHVDFDRQLDEAMTLGVNCVFAIGEALTRVAKPYLLHWFGGELFIFELTSRQAARLGIGPMSVRHARDPELVHDGAAAATSISLEKLEMERPILSEIDRPIVARCHYRVTGEPPPDFAFRMDLPHAAVDVGSHSLHAWAQPRIPLTRAGSIVLNFDPLEVSPVVRLNLVMAGFIRCYAIKESGRNRTPVSNAVAALLELNDGFQQKRGTTAGAHNTAATDAVGAQQKLSAQLPPAAKPASRKGFAGLAVYISPDGRCQNAPRPEQLDWDSTALYRRFHKSLLKDQQQFGGDIRLPHQSVIQFEWRGVAQTAGVAFWSRKGRIWAASLVFCGVENAQDIAALRQALAGKKVPLPEEAWQAILAKPERPLLATLHYDIRSVGDAVVMTAAPVLAAAFYAMFGAAA